MSDSKNMKNVTKGLYPGIFSIPNGSLEQLFYVMIWAESDLLQALCCNQTAHGRAA